MLLLLVKPLLRGITGQQLNFMVQMRLIAKTMLKRQIHQSVWLCTQKRL
jgi:hypothetical protein